MKKYSILLVVISLFVVSNKTNAQKTLQFFDEIGVEKLQTAEMDAMADTIAVVNHRWDDIAWSRTVYRVIDMRDKQNFQLYFPTRPNDQYRSLFRVMLDAVANGINVYKRDPRDIKPSWKDVLTGYELSRVFAYDESTENNLLQVDTITEQRSVGVDQYARYIRNQLKFLIQEKIFFDKHTSRMYSKIMAIAPLYALHPDNMDSKESMAYFRNSVICWFAFDELRPYLIRQFVVPKGNDTERMTFDDFFNQKMYSSYLLGESSTYGRMLLEYAVDEDALRAEQKRIDTELINFEEDLWEY
ncbi:MAG TPA: gliding motility protein GldN [Paludibacteraceae bacterium]|jgi:gliding motility associated protien GldN|nr:gliding motility protein GldN [Paludibacteraceae bacterium]HPS10125.1 gliding motility protein GldN [Paludibacteraceae bacterium]